LNLSGNGSQEIGIVEEHALFSGQFKGKCRNRGQIGHKAFQCKKKSNNNGGNSGNTAGQNYCSYCRKPGHVKKDCFKLKRKESQNNNNHASNNNGNRDNQVFDSQNVAFTVIAESQK
jgi:Zinc knuckle